MIGGVPEGHLGDRPSRGGWSSSHEFIAPKVAQPLLDRGYTVFAVVHGSNPRFQIPEIFEQMERSVRFIRHNAAVYGIDPNRIGVAGGSAGGHLSLMLATRGGPGKAGAVLVKMWKDVGMARKTPTGAVLLPDDPMFDPIYAHLVRQRRPLMADFADPIDAWLPLDPKSPHHACYASHPEWHVHGKPGFPSHADILAARDRMLAKHPDLIVIAAHMGSETHNLDSLGSRFDRFSNLYADVSARTPELQRHPAAEVREFFLRHQDRLLYGTDADQYTPGRDPTAGERAAFVSRHAPRDHVERPPPRVEVGDRAKEPDGVGVSRVSFWRDRASARSFRRLASTTRPSSPVGALPKEGGTAALTRLAHDLDRIAPGAGPGMSNRRWHSLPANSRASRRAAAMAEDDRAVVPVRDRNHATVQPRRFAIPFACGPFRRGSAATRGAAESRRVATCEFCLVGPRLGHLHLSRASPEPDRRGATRRRTAWR